MFRRPQAHVLVAAQLIAQRGCTQRGPDLMYDAVAANYLEDRQQNYFEIEAE